MLFLYVMICFIPVWDVLDVDNIIGFDKEYLLSTEDFHYYICEYFDEFELDAMEYLMRSFDLRHNWSLQYLAWFSAYAMNCFYPPKRDIKRFSSLTAEEFEYFRNSWEPFIVKLPEDTPYLNWTLKSFSELAARHGDVISPFGNYKEREKQHRIDPEGNFIKRRFIQPEKESRGAKYTTWQYICDNVILEQLKTCDKIFEKNKLPEFFKNVDLAHYFWNSRFEMWISRPEGGTKSHFDNPCEYIVSTQIQGKKRWMLSRGVKPTNAAYRYFDFYSEWAKVESNMWVEYDFILNPGEVLVFPGGMMHSTETLQNTPDTPLDQSFSMSFSNQVVEDNCLDPTRQWSEATKKDLKRAFKGREKFSVEEFTKTAESKTAESKSKEEL